MGRDALGQHHVTGRETAHLVHRLDPVAFAHREHRMLDLVVEAVPQRVRRRREGGSGLRWPRGRGRDGRWTRRRVGSALIDVGQDVLLGDPAKVAGAGDPADVHARFLRNAPDDRRGFRAQALFGTFGDFGRLCGFGRPSRVPGGGGAVQGRRHGCTVFSLGRLGRQRSRDPGGRVRDDASRVRIFGLDVRRRDGLRGGLRGLRILRPRPALDVGHDRSDLHRLPLGDEYLGERARGRGRNLGVHFVGRNLQDGLVALDGVARLLQPLGNGSLGDRFAHLGHRNFNARHVWFSRRGGSGRRSSQRPLGGGPMRGCEPARHLATAQYLQR